MIVLGFSAVCAYQGYRSTIPLESNTSSKLDEESPSELKGLEERVNHIAKPLGIEKKIYLEAGEGSPYEAQGCNLFGKAVIKVDSHLVSTNLEKYKPFLIHELIRIKENHLLSVWVVPVVVSIAVVFFCSIPMGFSFVASQLLGVITGIISGIAYSHFLERHTTSVTSMFLEDKKSYIRLMDELQAKPKKNHFEKMRNMEILEKIVTELFYDTNGNFRFDLNRPHWDSRIQQMKEVIKFGTK